MMSGQISRLCFLVTLLGCCSPMIALGQAEKPSQANPTDAALLQGLQQHVRAAAKKAIPSVVAVAQASKPRSLKHHQPFASGVIITPDGLILSQYHVSHMLDPNDSNKSSKPGERVKVILHDGEELEAELLGADRTYELSLLRLVKPGSYPHSPLHEDVVVRAGDFVLQLGHSLGFQQGRGPVVRLGRVLVHQEDTFVTDCQVTGGDSGGPCFSLDGRLVGLIRSDVGLQTLNELAAGTMTKRIYALPACSTCPLIHSRLESMQRKVLSPREDTAAGTLFGQLRNAETIPAKQWTQGGETGKAYKEVIKRARSSVVAIQDGDDMVAFGTIVGADGWIMTKASELPLEPRCLLPDGKVVAAQVNGVDPAFDLALLKVSVTGLRPIEWSDDASPPAGTILAVPDTQELPLSVGIVSVSRRELQGPFPKKMIPRPKQSAALPELLGSPVPGRGYWVEYVEGHAAAAEIQLGDIILTIGGAPIRSHQDFANCLKSRWSGERVPVRVLRAGKELQLTLRLHAEAELPINYRNDDFPTIFEHDAPLLPHECGGPVVGLDSKAFGITIARVGSHGCMAIPGDRIQDLLPDLKSGNLATNWVKPVELDTGSGKAPEPKVGKPVSLTLDQLKQRLTERAQRFKSLLVDYEILGETHVAPQLLAAWNMGEFRDYQERHRVAFSGAKRYSQRSFPAVVFHVIPADQITPDPCAPPEVAEMIERQRQNAANEKAQGSSRHLFARTFAEDERYVFDGSECFRWDFRKKWEKVPANYFHSSGMYLGALGLRPPDPQPRANRRESQQQFSFPDNFSLYANCRLLPNEEFADGTACVVVEAEREVEVDGKRDKHADKFWFDPALGYTLRRWEKRVNGSIEDVRACSEYEEFAPGCWLPWKTTWTRFTPPWVAPEYRNQPAFTYDMRLRKARVNDVSDDVFKPTP